MKFHLHVNTSVFSRCCAVTWVKTSFESHSSGCPRAEVRVVKAVGVPCGQGSSFPIIERSLLGSWWQRFLGVDDVIPS